MNLISELKWRGLLKDTMAGTEEQLLKEVTTGYIGFDPTSDSLHIGSLIPIILLAHLQKFGHKSIALIGGSTGMIGDPSGKSDERNLLSTDIIQKNIDGIKAQLSKFLPDVEIVNNYDWFKNISFLDFLRDVGKHITVNYMMSKDSVKNRIEGSGMSFTEFTYQLAQGYDFYWLNKHKGCKLQMGGSDQWGNITTGSDLIRKMSGSEVFAITCPLVTKADGGKFGKTEKGNIWLDSSKTSPYQFYQFWLNTSDEDAIKFIKMFTFLSEDEINKVLSEHVGNENKRIIQKKLAEEVTTFVHSKEDMEFAKKSTELLFNNGSASILKELSEEQLLQVMHDVPTFEFENTDTPIVDFLYNAKIFTSKGDSRRMIQGGGVSINKEKVDVNYILNNDLLLNGKYLFIQKGKKHYYMGIKK